MTTVTVRKFSLPRYTKPNTGHQVTDDIMAQLGGYGINGAIGLTGGRDVVISANRPTKRTSVDKKGFVDQQTYVMWRVNAGNRKVELMVALEPNDTYTVRLWKATTPRTWQKTGVIGHVLYEMDDVYGDNLIDVCDGIYVKFVEEHMEL